LLDNQFDGHLNISLRNETCNTFLNDSTHLWVTARYDECGANITVTDDSIIISNDVTVNFKQHIRSTSVRDYYYKYNILCAFARQVELSSPVSYNITAYGMINGSKSIELVETGTSSVNFNVSIGFYESTSFATLAPNPLVVTSTQYIHVGIKETRNNAHFKFIVNHCFATPTPSATDDISDTFFYDKCSLDSTFDLIDNNNDKFNFIIKPFMFIQVRRSVYFHCRLYICKDNSSSSACTQDCKGERYRRGVRQNKDAPSTELVLTSNQIVFKKTTPTCLDITCPLNSNCVELYPTTSCVCDVGYVYSRKAKSCTNQRILKITGLHLNMQWLSSYADKTSIDFIRFSVETETTLYQLFQTLETDQVIQGVTIIGARKGVVVDVMITYAASATKEIAYEIFVESIMSNASVASSVQDSLKIVKDWIPSYVSETTKESNKVEYATIIIAIVVLFLVLFISGITFYKIKQLRRFSTKEDVNGFDNSGIDMNNMA
jgi:hypothetical protein